MFSCYQLFKNDGLIELQLLRLIPDEIKKDQWLLRNLRIVLKMKEGIIFNSR